MHIVVYSISKLAVKNKKINENIINMELIPKNMDLADVMSANCGTVILWYCGTVVL